MNFADGQHSPNSTRRIVRGSYPVSMASCFWAVTTYSANMGLINNYILPVIGKTDVSSVNNHFVEKFYRTLSNMPAVDGANNKKSKGNVSPNTIFEIHKILRSCFRQAVKWGIMEKNPAIDATLPKRNKKKREIWTAEMLM